MAIHGAELDTFALIEMGKSGDNDALNTLFARYYKKVLRIVRLKLNSEQRKRLKVQSTDILQEVFLKAFKNLSGFQPTSEGSFIHWLSVIVQNVIHDELDFISAKKRASPGECSLDQSITVSEDKLHLRDLLPSDRTSPTQYILRRDTQTVLEDLLLELDEGDREVIVQHRLSELTFSEIGSHTGEREDAVRKRFNRAFVKLVSIAGDKKAFQELRS